MAAKKKVDGINSDLLKAIHAGHVTHVSKDEATLAGLEVNPPLIEVNTDPAAIVDGKAPVRLSEAGHKHVASLATAPAAVVSTSQFAIMSGVVLPESKRGNRGGGAGAPKKYPFDALEVGQTFFVPATAADPDPVKKLGSTISSANMRYAEKTGQTKVVERTKRGPGNKAVVGEDGKNVRETKTVDEYKFTRKFAIRPITKGQKLGDWVAETDGALIGRTQ